jgi:hypothetical protein
MAIDEVIDRATINFPGHLNLRNAERLLQYISENLPGNVHYFIENHNNFLYDREKGKPVKDRGTLKISANFSDSKEALYFDTAQLEPWSKNTSYVSSMRFQMIPGWELLDYSRVLPLWDNVRKLVGEYFDKRMRKSNK